MKRKGITPVISVILLLLIVIAIVGFAFVFFQRTAQTVGEAGQQEIENQIDQAAKKIQIDSVSGTSVTIRNTGSADINPSSVTFFVDNSNVGCSGLSDPLTAGSIDTCTLGSSCGSGSTLRVVAPGNTDIFSC